MEQSTGELSSQACSFSKVCLNWSAVGGDLLLLWKTAESRLEVAGLQKSWGGGAGCVVSKLGAENWH